MKIVAFMPIRLNSKRVKQKSIRELAGRPLFCWALQRMDALQIPVYVYCTDVSVMRECIDFTPQNVIFLERPDFLNGDEIKGIDIYKQFAASVPADVYLLAHATSPFIKTTTYKKALDAVCFEGYDSSLTVKRIQTFCWHDGRPINFTLPRIQTQQLIPVFVETSAAYVYRAEVLQKGDRSSLNPKLIELSSPEDEDIDYEWDFERCQKFATND